MLQTINYKKTAFFLIITLLVIWCIFYVIRDVEKSSSYRTVSQHAVIAGYPNVASMEENADIIIIGTPTKEFLDRESVTTQFPDGANQDFYSLTDLNIEKIIKNESTMDLLKDKTMQVVEPVAIIDNANGEKTKLTLDNYVEMQAGTSYLLFLRETLPGFYSIISLENGRFIMEEADINAKGVSAYTSDFHEKLKNEAFEKYGLNE